MAGRLKTFWQRVTDGIEIQQLWAEFNAYARASYKLYAADVDWSRVEGESRWKTFWRGCRALFWAMMMKLSPGRRVLFLISLALLFFSRLRARRSNDVQFRLDNLAVFGGIGLTVLLALELSDRVTMKRDLEIAREIQGWLMPSEAPAAPGVDVAFATRAANTVAGDYYDAFFRPATGDRSARLLLVVADVAGKSIPAALLMATLASKSSDFSGRSPGFCCSTNASQRVCLRAESGRTPIHHGLCRRARSRNQAIDLCQRRS